MTELRVTEVRKALNKNGMLKNLEIIDSNRGELGELSYELQEYIAGISDFSFRDKYFSVSKECKYHIDSFDVKSETTSNLVSILKSKRPVAILLYGEPGSGKSEYVKSLIAHSGVDGCFVKQGSDGSTDDRRNGMVVAGQYAFGQGGVVVMDEADEFLNTSVDFFFHFYAQKKGWLNDYLDKIRVPHIFIANRINRVETSVKRRFLMSVHFSGLSDEKQIQFFKDAVKKHPLKRHISDKFIEEAALRYKLTVAGICQLLDACHTIAKQERRIARSHVESILDDLFERQQELFSGEKNVHRKENQSYELSALHTDVAPEKVLLSIEKFMGRKSKDATGGGLNLLFHGIPGTGKTELAKHISERFKRKLLVKRGSELLNSYVGMTEKNIAHAFQEAERDNKILLIDEADTFLSSRENHTREWENTKTNEFLVRMEEFSGLLICTTNRLKGLDPASMRRFHWKIEFFALRPDDRLKLYKKYFPDARASARIERTLRDIAGLTCGDFNAVARRVAHMQEEMDAGEIAEELAREASYREEKRTKIGFK